jgi:hypothetical protein
MYFDRNLAVLEKSYASVFRVEELKMAIIVIAPAVTCKSYVAFVSGQALLCYACRSENHLQL